MQDKLNLYSEIIHSVAGGIIVLDSEANILLWNQWMEKTSLMQAKAVVDKNLLEIFPEIQNSRLWREIMQSTKRGTSAMLSCHLNKKLFPLYHKTVDQKNLEPLQHNVNLSAIKMEDGFACMVQIIDQTSSVQREQSLRRAKILAEEATRVKTDFVATMSHEIRTPLNGIVGAADLLSRYQFDDQQKDFIQMIQTSSQSLLSLLNDILDLSKLENSSMILEESHTSLQAIAEEVMSLFNLSYRERDVEGKVIIAQDVPDLVKLDGMRLKQVLFNLVGNAFKFTSNGSVTLNVELVYAEEGPRIAFQVIDTGIGISEGDLCKLFQRFQQVSTSTSRQYGGTGLGLAIVKDIVELMGGEISVQSDLGIGSCFSVLIPFHDQKQAVAADTVRIPLREMSKIPPLSILMAEDNEINQHYFQALLEIYGHKLKIVSDGLAAISEVKNSGLHYDIILMDMLMPGMNGIETTRVIRAMEGAESNIPIVALTAFVDKDTISKCIEAGMQGVAEKPIVEVDFTAQIMNGLRETAGWKDSD